MKFVWRQVVVGGLLGVTLVGCKDLAGTPPLPAGTSDPGIVQNTSGAVQTAVAAEVTFQGAYAAYILISGMVTDEGQANARDGAVLATGSLIPTSSIAGPTVLDARLLDQSFDWDPPNGIIIPIDTLYGYLQKVRALASQAIGGLATYAPDSVGLRGAMYASMGYAEIMLADLYCSGVPLTTLDYQGNFTYQPGSTTEQVYTHAIALFDTALTLAPNDPQVNNLAKVGKGRAYLAMGNYSLAGQAVSGVPQSFAWIDSVVTSIKITCGANSNALVSACFHDFNFFSVSDREGQVGLPFISSHDPRTSDTVIGMSQKKTASTYFPTKYNVAGISSLVLASGLEAQLITAEVDLNTGDVSGMFTILNALRKNNAATSGMPTLTDPGSFGAEVDTLFTERAAWLFVDGHRQGDLRRLMRNYVNGQGVHVVANQYPTGDYGYGMGLYGNFIDAPIPATELVNPHFTGCLSRD